MPSIFSRKSPIVKTVDGFMNDGIDVEGEGFDGNGRELILHVLVETFPLLGKCHFSF
jgi:hypothetical protein